MSYSVNMSLENLPNEIWKEATVGINGYYKVSSYGRVKTISRLVQRFGGLRATKEQILMPRKDTNGYYFVGLYIGKKKQKFIKLHSLVAKSFIENVFNKKCVNHKNGDKSDNRLLNLEWVTHKENALHAFANGLTVPAKGDSHHATTINSKQVLEIRELLLLGTHKKSEIARMYHIGDSTVRCIEIRKTWKHI